MGWNGEVENCVKQTETDNDGCGCGIGCGAVDPTPWSEKTFLISPDPQRSFRLIVARTCNILTAATILGSVEVAVKCA